MPWAVAGSIGAAAVGSAISGAMAPSPSGGSGGGGGPSYYVPTGLGTADTTWQNLLDSLSTLYGSASNDLLSYGNESKNAGMDAYRLYGGGYQNAANAAGNQYANLSSLLNGQASSDFASKSMLQGAGQNVYNMGLDPQSALYARTLGQVTDQTNALNSMYGLGTSGAGAGVADQAISNFNIDWQNNQLSRALQGLQGMNGAYQLAGQYGQSGQQAAAAAPGYMLQSGAVPFQTGQTIASVPGSLGNTYGQYLNTNLYGPAEGIMGQTIPYMNYGQGAQSVPFQNATNNANAMGGAVYNALNNSNFGTQIGNAFSNYFNPASGSFSGGNFSGAFTSDPYYSGGGNSYGFTLQ